MNYPDGTIVSVGDHIWWNEGSCVGFVHDIVESEDEQAKLGLDKPHILLSGFHPFNPGGPGYVAYAAGDFDDEGIGRLDDFEEYDLARAVEMVRSLPSFSQPYHVSCEIWEDGARQWVMARFEGNQFVEKMARVMYERLEKD